MKPEHLNTRIPEYLTLVLKRILIGLAVIGMGLLLFLPHAPARSHPKRIPVRFWHLLSGQWTEYVNRVADRFNRSQDKYEVIPLLLPDETTGDSKFLLAVAGGDPPDVMLHWTQAMSTWAEAGILQPLDTMMTPEEKHRFLTESYPVVRKSGWYKGHLYGITEGFDLFACYYRPADLRAIGLDHFPKTLEELAQVGKKLNRYDRSGHLTRLGFSTQDPMALFYYIPVFAGSFSQYDPKRGQIVMDTPQNRRALSFIVDHIKPLGFDNVLRFKSGLGSAGANSPFMAGTMAISLAGEWYVRENARYRPDLNYKVAILPPPAGCPPHASFSDVNYLVIPKGAKHAEGAWEFIKFLTGIDQPERAAEFYPWFCWFPMSPRQARTPIYQAFLNRYPQYRTFLELANSEHVETIAPVPYQLYLMDRIQQTDDRAEAGTIAPEAALKQLDTDMAREMARRKELGYVR